MQLVCFSSRVQLSKGMIVAGNRNPHNLGSHTTAGGRAFTEQECIMLDKTAMICLIASAGEIQKSGCGY